MTRNPNRFGLRVMLGFLHRPNDCFGRREDFQSRGTVTANWSRSALVVALQSVVLLPPTRCLTRASEALMPPIGRSCRVPDLVGALQDLFRRAREPWTVLQTSLARFRAVEGRIRTCEAREESSGTRNTASSGAARGAEARIAGRNRLHRVPTKQWTITRWREGSRRALWFSEGIRPLPMRRNPKRRFRPTRALGLVLRRGRPASPPRGGSETPRRRAAPAATPTCAVAGRCAYNLWISDINIRARMVRGRAPDTDARPIPAT